MQAKSYYQQPKLSSGINHLLRTIHIDPMLLTFLLLTITTGMLILYSASNQNITIIYRQFMHLALAFFLMLAMAQIPPRKYYQWIPAVFTVAAVLLVVVLIIGHIGKGAQRWLNLGIFRFQPSELMKLAVPMMLAHVLHDKHLPPNRTWVIWCTLLFLIPAVLIAKQPDLGTAIMVVTAGVFVLFLAGLSWRWIVSISSLMIVSLPILWHFMHQYQRERVLTFLNPERDPLGSGYHIIQSKIAIGSGGLLGKGWLSGTQSHLQFLPEHSTDFIFAVCGEEFGFLGCLILLALLLSITARALMISAQAQDTFSRLLAGSITLTFFVSFFVNIGMVTGILPVVGLPLPFVSYGGTSMLTLMAGMGIIMSIQTHRQLVGR